MSNHYIYGERKTFGVITKVDESKFIDTTVLNFKGQRYQIVALCCSNTKDRIMSLFEGDDRFMLAKVRHDSKTRTTEIISLNT